MPHGFPSLNLRARDAPTHCLGIHGLVTVPQFAHPVNLIANTGVGSKEIIELAIRAIKKNLFHQPQIISNPVKAIQSYLDQLLRHKPSYFIPIHLPSFIRRPPRDNGIPVFFDTRRFALVTPSARFHENDKPGPSFTAPPESPPNLPHLVHTDIYVYVDRFTDEPAAPTQTPAPQCGYLICWRKTTLCHPRHHQ